MKASELKDLIDKENTIEIKLDSEEIIDGPIILNLVGKELTYLVFINVTFTADVIITGLPKSGYLIFENCKFMSFIRVNNSGAKSELNESSLEIGIENCIVKNYIMIKSRNAIHKLSIKNTQIKELLIIKDSNITNQLTIFNTEIFNLSIQHTAINEVFTFFKNNIQYFNFINLKVLHLNIAKNSVNVDCRIDSSAFKDISIEDNILQGKLDIETTTVENIAIKNNEIKEGLFYHLFQQHPSTEMKSLTIEGGNYGNSISIVGNNEVTTVDKTTLKFSEKSKCFFCFENFQTNNLFITGTVNQSTVMFKNIETKVIEINNLFNYGQVSYIDIGKSKEGLCLRIKNSILGKTQFINCNLNHFETIDIKGTILNEITSTQTKWFEPSKLNTDSYSQPHRFIMNRDIYRQLKQAMYAQGDTIQAVEFKRYEMSEHLEVLNSTAIEKWSDAADRIMMFLNKSNSYGQNWLKAAVLSVLLTIFSYLIIASIHFQYQFPNSELYKFPECGFFYNSFDFIWQYKFNLFTLLDPTFSPEDIHFSSNKETIKSSTILLLLTLHRIILAYLIFQTILAFRKYIK